MDDIKSGFFVDGDTIFITLYRSYSFNTLSSLVLFSIAHVGEKLVDNILLDCLELNRLCVSIDKELINIEKFLNKRGIRLLLLDVPFEWRQRLYSQLPRAVWIDSTTAGYFGQQMKAKTFSHQVKARAA